MKSIDQIAALLSDYDPTSMRVEKVSAILNELVSAHRLATESLPLRDALGRVLAQNLISPINVPPHDNSAMDGFAFDGAQLQNGQALDLRVVGTALAGSVWQGSVGAGECIKIMTGAIMPQGLNTVVPQEWVSVNVQTEAAPTLHIPANSVKLGDNRRLAGEDLMQGQAALLQGDTLTPAAMGLLASLGLSSVRVYRKLRVAYFSTGDELLSHDQAPREGAVYDSNRYTVIGMLNRMGCEVIDMGAVRDDPTLLEAAFVQAASTADAIITSGGMGVGEADHTRSIMKKLGCDSGNLAFWHVAMRPGRPMAVGQIGTKNIIKNASMRHNDCLESYKNNSMLWFGLPGNPVAVMVTFLVFVRPALLRMMGATAKPTPLLQATSAEVIRKKAGRTEYQRGIVSTLADGSLQVKTTGNQGSGVLSSMVQANGLIVLHHDQGLVHVGDKVNVMMFEGVI